MKFLVPQADAYGGVLFDTQGRTLLREPTNHFGGYIWTFAKGRPDPGESPEQTALREVLEETGYACRVVGAIADVFSGSTSTTSYFLMVPIDAQGEFGNETAQTRWVDFEVAKELISATTTATGRVRDQAVLVAAQRGFAELQAAVRAGSLPQAPIAQADNYSGLVAKFGVEPTSTKGVF